MVKKIRKREKNQKTAFRAMRAYRKKHVKIFDKYKKLQNKYYRRQNSSDNAMYALGVHNFDTIITPTIVSTDCISSRFEPYII